MTSIRPFCAVLLALSLAGPAMAASEPPSPRASATDAADPGAPIDLKRFMGTWYVVAHVPYFTDRGHVAARDEYTLQPNGQITVRYFYRTGFLTKPIKSGATAKAAKSAVTRLAKKIAKKAAKK